VKILGIPTKVEGSFFVLSFFLAASRGQNLPLLLEWILVVLVSVLLHELGHALVARTFGLSPSIKLYSMGGLTSWESELTLTPSKHLLISLAGPAAGFLFGGIVFVAGPAVLGPNPAQLLAVAYSDLLWVNVGWGIFNLLPMLPLDGGQVLLTLEEWISKRKSRLVSHVISLMVALGITYLALSRRSMWIAILGLWFVYINGSALVQKLQTHRDEKIRPLLDQSRDALTKSEFDKALLLTRRAQKKARTTAVRSEAAQLLIFILIHQRQFKEAEEELIKFNGLFGEDSYLKGLFYFQKEEMATAIPHLKLAFDRSPTQQLGMILYQGLINEKRYVEAFELCGQTVLSDVSWKLYVNLQNEAFAGSEFRVATQAGTLAFEKQPDPNVAYNIACSLARDSEIATACEWLERAVNSGFNNKDLMATDSDLEPLRLHPKFDAILAKILSTDCADYAD
jgi:Zn-dependent protease